MSWKSSLAKKSLSYNRKLMDAHMESPAPLLLSVVFGIVSGFAVGGATDVLKPLEDDSHIAQEAALSQYGQALTVLQQKRDVFTSVDTQANLIPEALKGLIDGSEGSDDAEAIAEAKLLQSAYRLGMEDFIDAAHVDPRLNEKDVQELFARFSADHGEIDEVTPFTVPDYNDLRECRVLFNDDAQKVNECTHEVNEVVGTMLGTGGFVALLPWLLLAAGATQRRRFERWQSEPPKPKNNH